MIGMPSTQSLLLALATYNHDPLRQLPQLVIRLTALCTYPVFNPKPEQPSDSGKRPWEVDQVDQFNKMVTDAFLIFPPHSTLFGRVPEEGHIA